MCLALYAWEDFKGSTEKDDTLTGIDTIVHVYRMWTDLISGDFTSTHWLSDSTKFRFWETNDTLLGWYNMYLIDSALSDPESATVYLDTINPVHWLKIEAISFGESEAYVRFRLRDRRVR